MRRDLVSKVGFLVVGVVSGAIATLAVQPRSASALPIAGGGEIARMPFPLTAVTTQVNDVAVACGVYGLPGSPAVVALVAGPEGRPVKAAIESEIFGGDDAESCILQGLAGLPMARDIVRVPLVTVSPDDSK